jgi:hypothetical protein
MTNHEIEPALHALPEQRAIEGHNLEEREERYNTNGYLEEK